MGEVRELTLDADGCKGTAFFDDHGSLTSIDATCHCGRDVSDSGDCELCGYNPQSCMECRDCELCFGDEVMEDGRCEKCWEKIR